MVDQSIESAELVSALVDGQLQGDELVQALADLASSREARSNWDTYHLLGEVMRSGEGRAHAHDADFVLRLRQRMVAETIEIVAIPAEEIRAGGQKHSKTISANDGSWRRLAGLASVALAGVLAWQGLHWANFADPSAVPQLAQQNAKPAVSAASAVALADLSPVEAGRVLIRSDGTSALAMTSESPVMIRDPQLDALLAAHRQFGGTSALQMPAGFLRNATFEAGPR
jgi:sigma-E factor negative regulatory protein RseA